MPWFRLLRGQPLCASQNDAINLALISIGILDKNEIASQTDYQFCTRYLNQAVADLEDWYWYLDKLREFYSAPKRKEEMMINELKNANINRPDTEELVALLSFAWSLSKTYAELKIETPDWLDSRTKEITREINMRELANKDKRIKEVEARLTSLESTEEKKARLKRELEELKGSTSAAV